MESAVFRRSERSGETSQRRDDDDEERERKDAY